MGVRNVERVLETLNKLPIPSEALAKLSLEAVEGMGTFLWRAQNPLLHWIPARRLRRMWKEIDAVGTLSVEAKGQAFEKLFRYIKEGDGLNIPGWIPFLRKGPGTLMNSTAGFYNVVQHLAEDLKWQNIIRLEVRYSGTEGVRFVDILMNVGGRVKRRELKNLVATATFTFGAEVRKDIDLAIREAERLSVVNRTPIAQELAGQLRDMEYVFRGTASGSVAVVNGLRREIAKALGPYGALVQHVVVANLNRGVPF